MTTAAKNAFPTLIIFDCDGVLIDSEAIYSRIDAEELNRIGVPITAKQISTRFTGIPLHDVYARIERDYQVELDQNFRQRVEARVHEAMQHELTTIPGIEQVLAALPRPACVASSTGLASLHRNLQWVDLHQHFDPHIFSAEMVPRGKPAPDLFLHAAKEMAVTTSECVVIEDSVAGVTAARAAGMHTIGFVGASHADDALADRLHSAGAATVIDHHAKLLPTLGFG